VRTNAGVGDDHLIGGGFDCVVKIDRAGVDAHPVHYIGAGHLCWSPGEVMVLLTDWLPRKSILDADQRAALPDVPRAWLRFALAQRDISPEWIGPVIDAVDTYLPVFHHAFDDETAWGPAKQVAAALTERGVDLTDRHAVDNAIHQLNAEQFAHQLLP
jgi:hypothetical protein